MENIIVSACLLGQNCKYSGGNNLCDKAIKLKERYNVISVCPEQMGGLKAPRNPAEIRHKGVFTSDGANVTKEFEKGAQDVLNLAKENDCKIAVLKARSPSCGKGKIYDGSFSSTLITGNGKTAELLMKYNIMVYTENEIEQLL